MSKWIPIFDNGLRHEMQVWTTIPDNEISVENIWEQMLTVTVVGPKGPPVSPKMLEYIGAAVEKFLEEQKAAGNAPHGSMLAERATQ